jgi:hypothetical protein
VTPCDFEHEQTLTPYSGSGTASTRQARAHKPKLGGTTNFFHLRSRQIGFGSFFGEGGATVSGGVFRDDAAEEKEKRKERFTLREPGAQTAKGRLQ